MESSDVKRLKELEEENARLKRMYAELSLDHNVLKDVITKKGWGPAGKESQHKRLSQIISCRSAVPVN